MYHLIFVCKYRKKLLVKYGDFIKTCFNYISAISDFNIIEMEVDKDHIHLLVKSEPKVSVLQIVSKLKQMSARAIWKVYSDDLTKHFWKEHTFWSDGYFACSIGNVSKQTIEKYIKEQG
jgi:putative transposase